MGKKAIFLDKDGTLVEDVPYNINPDLVVLTPGAAEGLRLLQKAGYELIVITNQSGIARGFFPETAIESVETCLQQRLAEIGVFLKGFYYCPHHPDGVVPTYAIACDCRKPRPGLLKRAAKEHGICLEQSWFIGDILNDVEAGRTAGCRTVLIDNGNETEWELSQQRLPHHIVNNLLDAALLITAIDEGVLIHKDTPTTTQSSLHNQSSAERTIKETLNV